MLGLEVMVDPISAPKWFQETENSDPEDYLSEFLCELYSDLGQGSWQQ